MKTTIAKRNLLVMLLAALTLFQISSCSRIRQDKRLEQALRLAGKNRQELEKVLDRYAGKDSLKYRAAVFLISHMPGKYAKVFPDYDKYIPLFDTLESMGKSYEKTYKNLEFYKNYKSTVFRFFVDRHHLPPVDSLVFQQKDDLHTITSDYLIENIEYAFKAWEMPWNKKLDFTDFCEFILPYRYGQEELRSWRKEYFEANRDLIDRMRNITDPVKAAMTIKTIGFASESDLSGLKKLNNAFRPLDLLRINTTTSCLDESGVQLLKLRGLGVAVSRLHIPWWGNRGEGHELNGVLTADRGWVGFGSGGDTMAYTPPGLPVKFRITKVYAEIYSSNDSSTAIGYQNDLYYRDTGYIDVTRWVTNPIDLTLSFEHAAKPRNACICVFNNSEWVPVMQTPIIDDRARFRQIGADIIYMAGTIVDGELYLENKPFLLDTNNRLHYFIPDTIRQPMTLTRKYPPNPGVEDKLPSLSGCYFEGSNDSNFRHADLLWKIDRLSGLHTVKKQLKNAAYQYVRLVMQAPADRKSEGLGGIQFYSGEGKSRRLLSGSPISSTGASKTFYQHVFDNNQLSYVMLLEQRFADFPQFFEGENLVVPNKTPFWVGLRFDKKEKLSFLELSPRSDDNDVNIGEQYELSYWDSSGWVSLGTKEADRNELTFYGPRNALYYLVDLTKGNEQRLFLYQDSKQIWY